MSKKKQKISEIKKEIDKDLNINQVEQLIKDNMVEFQVDGVKYRTRFPTYDERQQAYKDKMVKYTELLNDDKFMLEEDLKTVYKEKRNIDVDEITNQINALEVKRKDLELKLGKILKETENKADAEKYKKEMENLQDQQYALSMRKTDLLQPSVEHQVLIYVYEKLTFYITEKFENKKWVPAWKNYDEYIQSSQLLVQRANFNASLLVGQL